MPDSGMVTRFLSNHFGRDVDSLERVRVGGNNKSWLATLGDHQYFVKQYFTSPEDPRDRLKNEYQFLGYAHEIVPKNVAAPVAISELDRVAVYERLHGSPILSKDVNEDLLAEAARFFLALNNEARFVKAAHLGLASEASFSITGHVNVVDERLKIIDKAIGADSDKMAKVLINEIKALWKVERQSILSKLQCKDGAYVDSLPKSDWCVSPSDFGFHNALITSDGIKFVDFEYAGWDDPAKMAGDFFSQLSVPVDPLYFDQFCDEAFGCFKNPDAIKARARLLLVLYRFKWCCIALNVFIPTNLKRRIFADPDLNAEELKTTQLNKARMIIVELEKYRVLH